MRILVTGGAGFIGSALIRHLIRETDDVVLNVDKLTYSGDLGSLEDVSADRRYQFAQLDIGDGPALTRLLDDFRPDAVMHLAAESHVDRSIDGPAEFIRTNVVGTYTLLEAVREHRARRKAGASIRFHHVSTDEVFGTLAADGVFTEESPYRPSSPYSATKAAADHLVRAWGRTYALPFVLTNSSNNFGPYQFPEKLIPLMVVKGHAWEPLPVYGRGDNVRDWLFVDDHVRALRLVVERGRDGATYNIGASCERTNLAVVERICDLLDEIAPVAGRSRRSLITMVADRPGHDQRYAIAATRIRDEIGWAPRHTFDEALRQTITWYLDRASWCARIAARGYSGQRLGLGSEGEETS